MSLTREKYSNTKTWIEKYPDCEVNISNIKYNISWKPLFTELFNDDRFKNINKKLSNEIEKDKDIIIHPAPNYVFNAFLLTPYNKVKVVFLGQDPYFDHEVFSSKIIHQAMGLSFSVPKDIPIPSSLNNIYSNLIKFEHIKGKPKHGNLESWAKQGCLMLNTSLTVLDGATNKNCHKLLWKWFTDKIIKYISDNKDKIIFVLWGADALDKLTLIDLDKHEVIISSHPSGLSANKPLKNYSSFASFDHFGQINNLLKKFNIEEINWNVL